MKIAMFKDKKLLIFDFNQLCLLKSKKIFSPLIVEASFKIAYFESFLNKDLQEILLVEIKTQLSHENLKEVIDSFPQYHVVFMIEKDKEISKEMDDSPFSFIREYRLYKDIIEFFFKLMAEKDYYMIDQCSFKKKIYVEDILYIESDGNYIIIYLIDQSHRVRDTIKQIVQDPIFNMFHEATRGILINLKAIKEISDCKVKLDNDEIIYVSKKNKKSFTKHYFEVNK
ncbi:MAG: LytTR family DNA-binding domain-containing protein [Erysipelotrichaceae bacterium]